MNKGESSSDPNQAANGDLGEVLGLVVHDLRNPLAALSSNLGFLKMAADKLDPELKEAIDDLGLSVEVLARIADSLEVLATDLRSQLAARTSAISVLAVMDSIRSPVERAAQSHGVELSMSSSFAGRVLASEPFFSRSLTALLMNAVSSAPRRSRVELATSELGQKLVFRVSDRGPAVPPELFEEAKSLLGQVRLKGRVEARYSRGLGLYVVARTASLAQAEFRPGAVEGPGSALELIVSKKS